MSTLTSDNVLALGVTQDQYDFVSVNRKSTFINLFDEDGEFVIAVNTLDMKQGGDFLFLAEVLRAAELAAKTEINSLVSYKGLNFRLAALQTSELNSSLKRNPAKKEDWKKQAASTAPQSHTQTPIQQQQVF